MDAGINAGSSDHGTSTPGEGGDRLQGRVLGGRYRVLHPIGSGGMGAVYLCEHVQLGRRYAVKVLHPGRTEEVERRFLQEARAASRIEQENVVDVLDYGQDPDGELFYVMEALRGRSLGQVLREEGPLPVGRALGLVEQVCRALAAAHARGVIHRDVKPDNVFVETLPSGVERAKLIDFGISHVPGASRHTIDGLVIGTPEYMAPEAAMGASVDPLSDVYAAGVLAYELLTGQPPISGESAAATLRAQRDRPASPPSALRPDLPPEVDRIILRALAKDPIDRYPSMAALAGEIMRARHTMAGVVRPSFDTGGSSGPTLPLEALPAAADAASPGSAPRPNTARSTSVSERRGGALAVALTAALGAVVLAALALWRASQGPASPPVVAEPRPAPSAAVAMRPSSAGPARAAPTAAVEVGGTPAAPADAPSPGAEAERAREVEAAQPPAMAGHRQELPRAAPAPPPAAGAVKDPYAVERDALKDNPFR